MSIFNSNDLGERVIVLEERVRILEETVRDYEVRFRSISNVIANRIKQETDNNTVEVKNLIEKKFNELSEAWHSQQPPVDTDTTRRYFKDFDMDFIYRCIDGNNYLGGAYLVVKRVVKKRKSHTIYTVGVNAQQIATSLNENKAVWGPMIEKLAKIKKKSYASWKLLQFEEPPTPGFRYYVKKYENLEDIMKDVEKDRHRGKEEDKNA